MFVDSFLKRGGLYFLFFYYSTCSSYAAVLDDAQAERIGELIFYNECHAQISCLTSWNAGEEFASLGIGHFIWYPEGVPDAAKRFDESFPKLLLWMKKQSLTIPAWLRTQKGNPWKNRAQFETLQDTTTMRLLRDFLLKTRLAQVGFMKSRLDHALPRILQHIAISRHNHIKQQFHYIAESPMGYYALMDYINFKGEGVKLSERYQGKGWGLLQVLEHMHVQKSGLSTIQAFSNSAAFVLTQRVRLSPRNRHEERWLEGWKKRLQSYVSEAKKITP